MCTFTYCLIPLIPFHIFFRIDSPGSKESEVGPEAFMKKCMKTGFRRVGHQRTPADCCKGRRELASSDGMRVSVW